MMNKLNNCIGCKKCVKSCPMLTKFSIEPKEFFKEINNQKDIDLKLAYSCNLCDVCRLECPVDISYKDIFKDIRRNAIKNQKRKVKRMGGKVVEFHQRNSFSKLFTSNSLKINNNSNKNKTIFFPGCSLSSYSPELVEKTYLYLKNKIEHIEIMLECCGKPTLAIGDEKKFQKYSCSLIEKLKQLGVGKIITTCPNCFNTLSGNIDNIEVTTLWEELCNIGVPQHAQNRYKSLNINMAIHDPCSIRNENNIHDSVRIILDQLGVNVIEFEKNKDKANCCGAGGMVACFNKEMYNVFRNYRANQTEEQNIVSYCQSCVESLSLQNKKSIHLLDLIFNENELNKNGFEQKELNTLNKWINRYKTRQMIVEIEGKL